MIFPSIDYSMRLEDNRKKEKEISRGGIQFVKLLANSPVTLLTPVCCKALDHSWLSEFLETSIMEDYPRCLFMTSNDPLSFPLYMLSLQGLGTRGSDHGDDIYPVYNWLVDETLLDQLTRYKLQDLAHCGPH